MPKAAWRYLREEFFGPDIRSSWVTAPAYNRISFAFIRVHLRFQTGTSRKNRNLRLRDFARDDSGRRQEAQAGPRGLTILER